MKRLRNLFSRQFGTLLSFVLTALAMQALMPAGVMIAPVADHAAQITLCPQTHPLARSVAEKASAEMADMVAMHAAMGHAMMDHAAMGHGPASPDDQIPAAPSAGQSCAFAGAGALAALLPVFLDARVGSVAETPAAALPMASLRLLVSPRLRPPLRGPPVLI